MRACACPSSASERSALVPTDGSRRLQKARLLVRAGQGGHRCKFSLCCASCRTRCSLRGRPLVCVFNCLSFPHCPLLSSPRPSPPPLPPCQSKLSRLCEQDKMLRTQEEKLQQMYREKVEPPSSGSGLCVRRETKVNRREKHTKLCLSLPKCSPHGCCCCSCSCSHNCCHTTFIMTV